MTESAGQTDAIFAAGGPTRQRLVRAAVACGIALLAAWLIALVIGVFGGFEALPLLPGKSHPSTASKASPAARSPQPAPAIATPDRDAVVRSQALSGNDSGVATRTQGRTKTAPKMTARPTQPSTPSAGARSQGQGKGLTQSTAKGSGKPVGSPGNGAGGSGAPGQLR